jgi:uncharacterized RDD family membrane protein YckC
MATTDAPGTATAGKPAPLFPRFIAFLVDMTLLGVSAGVVGWFLFDPLSDLGDYGRLIGLVVMLGYFGWFDSKLGAGSSPGKRLLGLQVVRTDGAMLSPSRAALRAAVLAVPLLANGVTSPESLAADIILAVIVFGLLPSLIYLAVFNRPTRRSLHDLATAAVVVRRHAPPPPAVPVWNVHWAVVGVFCLLGLAASLWQWESSPGDINDLQSIGQRVEALPDVRSAGVSKIWSGKLTSTGWVGGERIKVTVELRREPHDRKATARAVAAAVYGGKETVIGDLPLTVVLSRGFELGIFHWVRREVFHTDAKESRPPAT